MQKEISPAKTFEDLIVWQKAHAFTLEVYQMTQGFPQHEMYGLCSQFRRAAVSVAANIAEGFKKRGRADKSRYLNIAQASLEECRYYIILSRDLGYHQNQNMNASATEVSKLLTSYTTAILNPES